MTKLGTPCSRRWRADWVARVEEAEARLGRRVCGAATWDGGPCVLAAEHGSGRCRYHGGHAGTGAPRGSANAQVHGLYARRLQRCGRHCPLWASCPFAGEDVLALPVKGRPVCAYERAEYVALMKFYFEGEEVVEHLTTEGAENTERGNCGEDFATENTKNTEIGTGSGYRGSGSAEGEANAENEAGFVGGLGLRFYADGCGDPFLVHQLVLLTIMQTRAAAVLSQSALTDAVEVDSPGYTMKSAKPGAALEAFIRIAREYRALAGMIDRKKLVPEPKPMGIGSRLRPLMLRGRAALDEAIVDLDAVDGEKPKRNLTTESTERTENSESDCGEEAGEELTTESTECTENSESDCGEEAGEVLTTESTERSERDGGAVAGEEFTSESTVDAEGLPP